ncbi:bestrophin family protein [Aestuariivirga litoralis]|uniref:bestrophin family protein n=1 Tax=Aestuariivirga litoralis TaxID=2650924 RepID=UPI0018C815CB|nr:bestrophin family ion channel [Aestuariivirga litoralis]MBG1233850.1 hypothetical protein [Aestuariivirga litoralis]
MIVRESPRPWELFFIMQGSIVPVIWRQVAAVVIIAGVITFTDLAGWLRLQAISPLGFSLIGIALSIFSGFRNSASYERWWEARKILGQHIVEMRCLTREVVAFVGLKRGQRLAYLMLVFATAFKSHLRKEGLSEDCLAYAAKAGLSLQGKLHNRADYVVTAMGVELANLSKHKDISPQIIQVMEERLVSISGVLAAAERIKLTPLPFAYSLLLQRTAYMFCFLLPFGLVESAGAWTPILAGIVAYTFFGLDALGDQLAAPFGTTPNSLPLNTITRVIEVGILEGMGEKHLPPMPDVVGYVMN